VHGDITRALESNPSNLAPGPFGNAVALQGGSPQDHKWRPSPGCPAPLRSVAFVWASWPCTWPQPCTVAALQQPSILAPGPLGNATASSQGDSPIKTTGDGLLQGGSLHLGQSLLCTPDVASWPCTPRPCAAVGPQPPCPRTRNRAPQTSGGLQALSEKTRGVASVARCSAPDSLSLVRGPVSSSTPAISAVASPSNGSGTTGRMFSGSAQSVLRCSPEV
jgi:hypothetical protein